jgi:hypothetical protein
MAPRKSATAARGSFTSGADELSTIEWRSLSSEARTTLDAFGRATIITIAPAGCRLGRLAAGR